MSTPTVREQFLVISALGANPMELTNVLCRASHENRCAVVTSRLTATASAAPWYCSLWQLGRPGTPRKAACPCWRNGTPSPSTWCAAQQENRPQALPYVAYVSAAYRPDIINELCQFFMDHNVELENLTCDTYQAPQTGSTMLNAQFTVTCRPAPRSAGCATSSWTSPTP
jgi:glycine cleavage system transcriptional repressor